jgi:hypothetical protein
MPELTAIPNVYAPTALLIAVVVMLFAAIAWIDWLESED